MAVKIVTDSACDLPAEIAAGLGLEIVPIRVNLGRSSYRDGVDINPREIAQKILRSGELPTTSQPPPIEFERVFTHLLTGDQEVFCLTLSSVLSGTYHSALIAAAQIQENLRILDTKLVSAGQGLLALQVARFAALGHNLTAVDDFARTQSQKIRTFATLDNVEPIIRGGRLNLFARHAAGQEGIKLIFTMNSSGGIQILERVRGRRRSLDRLIELMTAQSLKEIAVVHGESPGEAREISQLIANQSGATIGFVSEAGGTVGTYAGRGAVIVAGC